MCITIALLSLLSGCSSQSDAATQLENILKSMAKSVEQKNRREVTRYFSNDFTGNETLRRENLDALVFSYFNRHKHINVTIMDLRTTVEPDSAKSEFRLLLTGSKNVLPEQLRWLQVEVYWLRQDDEWLIHRALWQDVGQEPTAS